jgi:TIR domain
MGRIERTVFISYRRHDAGWANAIFMDLTHHGYDVFIDYEGIGSGNFETAILENIRARAHFLALLTPTALERKFSIRENERRDRSIACAKVLRVTSPSPSAGRPWGLALDGVENAGRDTGLHAHGLQNGTAIRASARDVRVAHDGPGSRTALTHAALASSVSSRAYLAIVMSQRIRPGVADNLRNGPRAVAFNALEDCLACRLHDQERVMR